MAGRIPYVPAPWDIPKEDQFNETSQLSPISKLWGAHKAASVMYGRPMPEKESDDDLDATDAKRLVYQLLQTMTPDPSLRNVKEKLDVVNFDREVEESGDDPEASSEEGTITSGHVELTEHSCVARVTWTGEQETENSLTITSFDPSTVFMHLKKSGPDETAEAQVQIGPNTQLSEFGRSPGEPTYEQAEIQTALQEEWGLRVDASQNYDPDAVLRNTITLASLGETVPPLQEILVTREEA